MTSAAERGDPGRRLVLLDGDPEPELAGRGVVVHPSPGALPLPIREPLAVRTVLRDAALAGADVLTAPTGGLHRRALARIGAARRSREWIAASLALARDAASEAEDAGRPLPGQDPPPRLRIAGLVLPLESADRPDLAPDASSAEVEHRTHAGLLAEEGAEILRIERIGTITESDAATRAAVETGLPTWTGVALSVDGTALGSGEPLAAWADAIAVHPVQALLLAADALAALESALGFLRARTDVPLGAAIPTELPGAGRPAPPPIPEAVRRLVSTGASLVWPAADGSPANIAAARAAIDQIEADQGARALKAASRTRAWVEVVARRASPGRALWLGGAPAVPLPPRFAWDVVREAELPRLPGGRYAIAVAPGDVAPEQAARLVEMLEPGGWLLVAADRDVLASDGRLEALEPVEAPDAGDASWIARRRP